MHNVHHFLAETAARALPRILTQICRDPGAPFFGACDRNWWHYKIRDFPSIILQQAGYALHCASKCSWGILPQAVAGASCPSHPLPLLTDHCSLITSSTARFWNQRALKHGAFEEYYPYEQGYPPVAFATLAVAKLCHENVVPLADIKPGLTIAAKQLLTRFEAQAANQQIAGTAALAVIRTIAPDLIEETTFQKILTRILDLQHSEGWFPEYDGPDLGYLAVSIDCLYDIHDHTQDPRILPAIRKAADFIAWFALSPVGSAGMHNSRNTDYITPYGLVRLALEESNPAIITTVEKLFTRGGQRTEDGEQRFSSPITNHQSPPPPTPNSKLQTPLPPPNSQLPTPISSPPPPNLQSPISFSFLRRRRRPLLVPLHRPLHLPRPRPPPKPWLGHLAPGRHWGILPQSIARNSRTQPNQAPSTKHQPPSSTDHNGGTT